MNFLPICPPTSVIVLWGRPKDEGANVIAKKLRQYVDKLKYFKFTHPSQRKLIRLQNCINVQQRIIAVYEDQFDLVQETVGQLTRKYPDKLRQNLDKFSGMSRDPVRAAEATLALSRGCPFSDLYGYELLPFPRQKSIGMDRNFLERALIRNPGYLLMVDADISHCFSRNRYSGIQYHSPENFTAVVCHVLRVAEKLKLKLWGISPDQNAHVNWGSEPVSVGIQEDLGFNVGSSYIRNFFGIAKDAVGSWGPQDLLEDKWRSLSEYGNDPRSVGLWWYDQIRYPRTEKNTTAAYENKPGYRKALEEIKREFGSHAIARMGHMKVSEQRNLFEDRARSAAGVR